jgi:phosphoglucosamine mutase
LLVYTKKSGILRISGPSKGICYISFPRSSIQIVEFALQIACQLGHSFPRKLFGTDGVRGIANKTPMDVETAVRLGRALAHSIPLSLPSRHKVLIGKDTRVSSDMLEMALAAGVCSMGADVLLVGTMPTPGIAFLTVNMRCDAGAVISASHNPFEDNGIKFFSREGFKLSDEVECQIEEIVFSNDAGENSSTGALIGRTVLIDDALGRYVVFVKSSLPKSMDFGGMKVALDCANGAAYRAAPMILEELGADVTPIAVFPDGSNINKDCGSLHPGVISEEVRRIGADIGVALDGDADRAIFADENGNEVDGDQIMGLIAWDMMGRGELKKNTVVATVMSNVGLEIALRDMGVQLVRTPVGDRYVVEEMRSRGCNFGGEQSGHLILLDSNTSGDGVLSALQVMRIMKDSGQPLSKLASRVTKFPQFLKNVVVSERRNLNEFPEVALALSEANKLLGRSGRLLVRYSGTQLLCRVMAEGEDEIRVKRAVDMVVDAISRNI